MVLNLLCFECKQVFHVDLETHLLSVIVFIPSADLRVVWTHFLNIGLALIINSI